MRTMARTRSSSVERETASTPDCLKASPRVRFADVRSFLEAPTEALVVGVHVELFARLRVLHDQRTDVRQLDLASIEEPNGQHLVTLREQVEGSLPARCADEVGDHEDERPTLDRSVTGLEERGQIGERRCLQTRMVEQVVDETQDLDPPAPRRDRALHATAVEDRPDAIPVPGQQPCERGHEVDQHAPFEALRLRCAEVDGGAQVKQEPGCDLAILDVLADVGRVHPGGHAPVDVPDVVAVLVLAQVREVHAVAEEQAPVVALEQAIEPADDLPVEALEDALRR